MPRSSLPILLIALVACLAACAPSGPPHWESETLMLQVDAPEGFIVRPDRFDEEILLDVYIDDLRDSMYNPQVQLKDMGPAQDFHRAVDGERNDLDTFPKITVLRDTVSEMNELEGWYFEATYRSVSKDIRAEIFLFEREGRLLKWAYLRSPFEDSNVAEEFEGVFRGLKPLTIELTAAE